MSLASTPHPVHPGRAPTRTVPVPRRLPDPWTVRMVNPILDRDGRQIGPQLGKLQGILETMYRSKPHAWWGISTIAFLYGCGTRNMQLLIRKAEDAGMLRAVVEGRGRKCRVGFLALKRFDPDRPVVADTPEAIARGIAELKADPDRAGKAQSIALIPREESRAEPPEATGKAQSIAPIPPENAQWIAPELRVSSKEDPTTLNVAARAGAGDGGMGPAGQDGPPAERPGPGEGEEARTRRERTASPEPVAARPIEVPAVAAGAIEPETGVSPPAAPTEEKILELLRKLPTYRDQGMRNRALWILEDCGRLPDKYIGKVPPRPTSQSSSPHPRFADPRPPDVPGPPGDGGNPASPPASPGVRPAPRVGDPARVRSAIARLAVDRDDPDLPMAVARYLADALRDPGEVSRRTFAGLAGDVQRGGLAVGCLLEAFEEACGGRKVNRGAAFIHAVKRWKGLARRPPAPPPGPGARASYAGGASC